MKLLALPVVAPLAVLLDRPAVLACWRCARSPVAAAPSGSVLLIAYAGALAELWESVVTDHRHARDLGPSSADNVDRVLLHPLDWRTPAGVLVPIGLVCAVLFAAAARALALVAWIVGLRRVPRLPAAAASTTTSSCSQRRWP